MTDARAPRHPDRLAETLRALALRVHRLDRGSRLQIAVVCEDALERLTDPQEVEQ